ncbi:hypothetical protein [Kitasatospora sp. NPDC057223]|uniref:hypothetical protein n=1 Tax=Kitasatospora sp. NPDC057223 TaxID=3346055 RepID=UPI003644C62B
MLSKDQITVLADAAVADLARRLAARAMRPLSPAATPTPGQTDAPSAPNETVLVADALTRLHALEHLRRAAERLARETAREAARAGAGYPQLGEACDISRQGARKRWPGILSKAPSSQS